MNIKEKLVEVIYNTNSKVLKAEEGENRVLRKLLSDREIELELQRELLKKSLGPQIKARFSKRNL